MREMLLLYIEFDTSIQASSQQLCTLLSLTPLPNSLSEIALHRMSTVFHLLMMINNQTQISI